MVLYVFILFYNLPKWRDAVYRLTASLREGIFNRHYRLHVYWERILFQIILVSYRLFEVNFHNIKHGGTKSYNYFRIPPLIMRSPYKRLKVLV